MKIIPVASDSLGVRSMATYIETKDCKIFIDPSAALGPNRYGLPPAQKELEALYKTKKKIAEIAKECDIIVISHYHFDHYDPDEDFYKNKKVFAKDISNNINKSQKERGTDFKKIVENKCDLIYCDNSEHKIGSTKIIFSQPFFHGPEKVALGYVLMTTIYDGKKRITHSSDVQGPVTKDAKDYIIEQKPDLLIMDGPPTIFLGWKFSKKNLEDASNNLVEIIEKTGCDVILDHHLLRDLKYKEVFPKPYEKGGMRVKTFAEYLGKENNTLEAHRKELWGK
ncbi:MAG: MBL fold metallo-hydrolase [Candidatus Thermoplasmatota archaeon]|jgi:predicted metallo-beta-lactamase superfamily hydrolase|nr:MBL fold metallo-hydrolase [Candidatus Thermoplasmatota archaeon]